MKMKEAHVPVYLCAALNKSFSAHLFKPNVLQMHTSPNAHSSLLFLLLGDHKYPNKICCHAFEYD